MRRWVRYLPWALVTWLARRDLERFQSRGTTEGYHVVVPFKGEIYCWKEDS